MKKMSHTEELRESILFLEKKQANEGALLKEQFMHTYESLKPSALIKNTLDELAVMPDLEEKLMKGTVNLTTDFLSKKVFNKTGNNPFKQLVEAALQMGVANIFSNSTFIKSAVAHLVSKVFQRKKQTPIEI